MSEKRKRTISIPLVLLMYAMIFNPPLLAVRRILPDFPLAGLNWVWMLMLPSAAYVLLNRKALKAFTDFRAVLWTEIILGVMLVYLMGTAWFHGNPVTEFGYVVYWMAGDVPFALAVWIFLRKRGQGFSELLDHILTAGTAMAVTSVLAFLIPPVKEFFTQRMEDYGIPYTRLLSTYRNFGLAANMTSTASYVQALLSGIALYRAVRGRKIWFAAFPLLAFSANINTRASILFIPAGLAAILVALLHARKMKEAGKFAILAVAIAAVAFFGKGLVRLVNPETDDWLTKGLGQMAEFASGTEAEEGYFSELKMFTEASVFPKGTELVFGTGESILWGNKYGVCSDVGFINDLWRGGILYFTAIIGLFILTLWKIMHSGSITRQDGVFLSGFLLLVFLLNNIKGSFFLHTDVTAVAWLLIPALDWNRGDAEQEGTLTEGE